MQQLASSLMQGGNTQAEPALEHAFSGASVPGGSVLEGRPVSVPSEQSRPPQVRQRPSMDIDA